MSLFSNLQSFVSDIGKNLSSFIQKDGTWGSSDGTLYQNQTSTPALANPTKVFNPFTATPAVPKTTPPKIYSPTGSVASTGLTDFGVRNNPQIGKSLYEGAQNFVSNLAPVKTIAGIAGGQSPAEAINRNYNTFPIEDNLKVNTIFKDLVAKGVPRSEALAKANRQVSVNRITDYANQLVLGTLGGPELEATNAAKAAGAKALNELEQTGSKIAKDTIERGFVKSVKEEFPQLTKIAGQYIPRDTDILATKAMNLVKSNIDVAEGIARTRADDIGVAVGSQLIKHYGELAANATDEATKMALGDRAAAIANPLAKQLTEQGRSIQAASILSRLTPEGQVQFAAREIQRYNEAVTRSKGGILGLQKKIPELTGQQASEILTEMKAIQDMPEGTAKAMRFQQLQNKITDLVPTSLFKKIVTIWKAGLLTGVKTSGLNILSNVSHGASEIAKDIPGSAVDSVASLFTGKRTLVANVRGQGGLKEGFQKGWQYFKTGFDERNIGAKLDYNRVNFGKGKIAKALQGYEETIFRAMGSEDQPFYYGAKARSLANQAIAQAKNAGVKGAERSSFIKNLIQNPTDQMLKYAVSDAETAVFQNRTLAGEAARSIQKIGGGLGEVIVPFGKTPAAVATQIVNYSPVGIVKTIIENIGKGRFDQRLFSQGLGRGITGTAALAIGAALYNKNFIALDRPTSESEQELWNQQGKVPNSIKLGNKWRSIQALGPPGTVLVIGGQFERAYKKTGSPSQALVEALAAGGKSFSESTFLQGINQLTSVLADPTRSAANYAKSLAGSVVPTIVADVARAIDPLERRAENPLQQIESRIPKLRQRLEPQVNAFGNLKKRVGNPLEVLFDPTRPSPVRGKDDPVIPELERLGEFPTKLGGKNGYSLLSPQENTLLWRRSGDLMYNALYSIVKDPAYPTATDEERRSAIVGAIHDAKVQARAELLIHETAGLEGRDLLHRLSQFKYDKNGNELPEPFLTDEVFNLYQEYR